MKSEKGNKEVNTNEMGVAIGVETAPPIPDSQGGNI